VERELPKQTIVETPKEVTSHDPNPEFPPEEA